ncbi:MAG: hypothetical protein Q4P15_00105 [Propionibacteriaceae bacterium]|nr:hypothetical protein [Propionibacteriaceae bacterium]
MSKALNHVTPWIAAAALVITLSACGGDSGPSLSETPPNASVQPSDPSAPMGESASPGDEQTFDDTGVTSDTITANKMEILIPSGIRVPEDALVTEALPASIMMADPDPTAVTDMVNKSAEEAGYEVYAEVPGGKVFVGNGNAVLFTAAPNAQMITWGPEEMKDLLAGK